MDTAPLNAFTNFAQLILEQTSEAIFIIDPITSAILDANPAAQKFLGLSLDEMRKQSVIALNRDIRGPRHWALVADAIRSQKGYTFVGRHHVGKDQELMVEVINDVVQLNGREVFVSMVRNLEQQQSFRQFQKENEFMRGLAMNEVSDGLWDWNVKNDTLFLSPQWFRMVGLAPEDNRDLTSIKDWKARIHPEDERRVVDALNQHLAGKTARYECKYRLKNCSGSYIWVFDRGQVMVRDAQQNPVRVIGLVIDITESQRLSETLLRHSRYDDLTGLMNRKAGYEVFERELAIAKQIHHPMQVVMFDLDNFKHVNDLYGHLTGDKAIRHFASVMSRECRKQDVMFRWGGEEFLMLCPNMLREQAISMVSRLVESFSMSGFESETGEWLSMTCSAGIASFPEQGEDIKALVRQADNAMYRAKATGRNRVVLNTFSAEKAS